jgi:hypothetical protein
MAYVGFEKLKGQLAGRPGVTNPGGLARAIGERKYGKQAFQQAAARGTSLRGHRPKKTARHQAIQRFVRHHHG